MSPQKENKKKFQYVSVSFWRFVLLPTVDLTWVESGVTLAPDHFVAVDNRVIKFLDELK